jgi:hypothetical protein
MVLGTVDVATTGDEARGAETPRPALERQPALDGLRGVAVAAVVAFHLEHLQGGFLGVDLFFVLSGFLITSLLLVEFDGRRAIDLGRFWSRRARRLLPALFLLLGGLAFLVELKRVGPSPGFRGDALSTLGYVANWHAMTQDHRLLGPVRPAVPARPHVEPGDRGAVLPAVAAHRPRSAGAGPPAGGEQPSAWSWAWPWPGALASFAIPGAHLQRDRHQPRLLRDRRPGGTDAARRCPRGDRDGRPPALGDPRGRGGCARPASPERRLVGAGGRVRGASRSCCGSSSRARHRTDLLPRRAPRLRPRPVVIVAVVVGGRAGPLGAVLGFAPLRWLGIISYGVYLWHWPVIVYATPERTGLDGWVLDAVCVAGDAGLAIASFVLIERPIRRGALRGGIKGLRAPLALGGAIRPPSAALVVVATVGAPTTSDAGVVAGPSRDASDFPKQSVARADPGARSPDPAGGRQRPIFLGPALADEAEREGAVVAYDSEFDCTARRARGQVPERRQDLRTSRCATTFRRDTWAGLVERFDPDIVVYLPRSRRGPGPGPAGRRVGSATATRPSTPTSPTPSRRTLTVLGDRGATVRVTPRRRRPWRRR